MPEVANICLLVLRVSQEQGHGSSRDAVKTSVRCQETAPGSFAVRAAGGCRGTSGLLKGRILLLKMEGEREEWM